MSELKRLEVKYLRDGIKSNYQKETECSICGAKEELQLHHYKSFTPLWNKFKKKAKIVINSVEDLEVYKQQFYSAHWYDLVEDCVTLCKEHHMNGIHRIYGKTPSLATAEKQKRWVQKQKDKRLNNGDS